MRHFHVCGFPHSRHCFHSAPQYIFPGLAASQIKVRAVLGGRKVGAGVPIDAAGPGVSRDKEE